MTMHNHSHSYLVLFPWDPPSGDVPPHGDDVPADASEFYRKQADRLRELASSSIGRQARGDFLDLAQRYEVLAEHAAIRVRGV